MNSGHFDATFGKMGEEKCTSPKFSMHERANSNKQFN